MHLVLQVHAKRLLNYYFFEDQYNCYIGKEKKDFNQLLSSHSVPHNLSRKFPTTNKFEIQVK
jgi:hypothetical protein